MFAAISASHRPPASPAPWGVVTPATLRTIKRGSHAAGLTPRALSAPPKTSRRRHG